MDRTHQHFTYIRGGKLTHYDLTFISTSTISSQFPS